LNDLLSHHTGQSVKTIEKDTERDNFMGPVEAKEYGLIDELIESRKDDSESNK
jgi:ATP-dependent Clp protease protease subunit